MEHDTPFVLEEEKETFTLQREGGKPTPLPSAANQRAAKANYALGEKSPGIEALRQRILSGQEDKLRAEMTYDEDIRLMEGKQKIISQLAQYKKGNLTPYEADIVMTLSKAELSSDPGTILEKKFAERFVNDVMSLPGAAWEQGTVPQMVQEAEVATNVKTWKEWIQNEKHTLEAKRSERGWLPAIGDVIGQSLPFLPWYRQRHALSQRPGIEWLPGETMEANLLYVMALPMERRIPVVKQAIEYLEGNNLLDAQTFIDGLVGLSTADIYLAHSIGVADYAAAGSLFRWGVKLFTGGSKAAKAAVKTETPPTPSDKPVKGKITGTRAYNKEIGPGRASDEYYAAADDFEALRAQGELFGPEQLHLRGILGPEQTKPGLPPGKLRATHETPGEPKYPARDLITGRMVRKPVQNDLPGIRAEELTKAQSESMPMAPALDLGPPVTVTKMRKALVDAVKATEGPELKAEAVLSAVGEVEQAGAVTALKRLTGMEGPSPSDLPTFARPGGFFEDSKVLGREYARRLMDKVTAEAGALKGALTNAARVTRMPEEAVQLALTKAHAALKREFVLKGNSTDAILDVGHVPAEFHWANVDTGYITIGRKDATPFRTEEEARWAMREEYGFSDDQYDIEDQGFKFLARIYTPLNESDDMVRDAMVAVPKNKAPHGMITALIGRVMSAADILPRFQMNARVLATHAPQGVRMEIKKVVKDNLDSLSKQSRREVEDMLRLNRDTVWKDNPGRRGVWYNSAAEFETEFLTKHGKLPEPEQIRAYDTYRRLSDFDWMMRNSAVYRDMARQGAEDWQLHLEGISSDWFAGISHQKMPWNVGKKGDQDAGVYVWDSGTKTGKYYYKMDMTDAERAYVDKLVSEQGFRVVQTFFPDKHPLEGVVKHASGEPVKDQINYIISNSFDKKTLTWNQLDYNPGGHVVYPHEWYVSQAVIATGRGGKDTYFGDNNILNFRTKAEAVKYADLVDRGRVLLKGDKLTELNTFLRANLPFYDMKAFRTLFERKDSPFSLEHPVTIKQAGKNTIDTVPWLKKRYEQQGLINSKHNIHDPSAWLDKTFYADKDLILKTVDEGVMRLADAEQLDPFASLQRGLNQSLRGMWLNDYKNTAIETFFKDFSDVMAPPQETLNASPTYFLYNPQWKNVEDKGRLAAAKANQRAIVNFLGTKSELRGTLDWVNTKLVDSIYRAGGQTAFKAIDKIGAAAEAVGLHNIKDPATFMRGVAFHNFMGFFNPVQMWLQMQTLGHTIGVAGPVHGIPGVAGGIIARFALANPGQIDTLAKAAKGMGWKETDFKEMVGLLQRSNVKHVGDEAILRLDEEPTIYSTTAGRFLNKGTMFFNEGERLARLGAFSTAYREFRKANPGKRIGDRELSEIMYRTDVLSVNMTKAAMHEWQTGVLSVPTQFFSFNAQLVGQFWGGRLSGKEKARALLTHSILYGVPGAVGAATFGISPLGWLGIPTSYDDIKQEAMLRNIDINEGFFKAATEGVLSMLTSYITGQDYNVAARFGPGTSTSIGRFFTEDKTITEMIFGASGSIISDVIKAAAPLAYHAASVFSDSDSEYPVMADDWLTLARNIKTADILTKAYFAGRYGQWITKSGTIVGEANSMDAVMALLGLTPKHIDDVFVGKAALKKDKDARQRFEDDAVSNFRKAIQYGAVGDWAAVEGFMKRAKTSMKAGDYDFDDQLRIYRRALSSSGEYGDKIRWDLYDKARASRKPEQLDKFIKEIGKR